MIDKEIIIDGVDVSGCEDFREGYCHPDTGVCYKCDTNCQYAAFHLKEQLARKEQECEELKSQVNEDYNYYTTELKTLRDIIRNKEKRNAALSLTSGRYRKALDEIEEYFKTQCISCKEQYYNQHCED